MRKNFSMFLLGVTGAALMACGSDTGSTEPEGESGLTLSGSASGGVETGGATSNSGSGSAGSSTAGSSTSAETTADSSTSAETTADSSTSAGTTGALLDLSTGGSATASGTADGDGTGGDCTDVIPPTPDGQLTGTVYAPNLELPISGAIVYLTDTDPEPIPDGVYCATCVTLECGQSHVFTEADGSFVLPSVAGPGQKLVVQKGQFLHVTDFDVLAGNNNVAVIDSALPGEWNPAAGLYIPRIAVMDTSWDEIFNVLAKVGLADVDSTGAYIPGTENFEVFPGSVGGASVLDDPSRLDDFHIVFVPCMSQGALGTATTQRTNNIRDWTDAGGKWYVTDWANEYLYDTFPNYQTLHNQNTNPDLSSYTAEGYIDDPGMLIWLASLPPALKDIGGGYPNLLSLPVIELEDNWSGIDSIPPVIVQDEMGMDVDVGHKAWVRGPCESCSPVGTDRPMTISGQYGCGRMMFSTYHTNETAHAGLTPQELVLMYLILEIGVCFDGQPPPPPPIN